MEDKSPIKINRGYEQTKLIPHALKHLLFYNICLNHFVVAELYKVMLRVTLKSPMLFEMITLLLNEFLYHYNHLDRIVL